MWYLLAWVSNALLNHTWSKLGIKIESPVKAKVKWTEFCLFGASKESYEVTDRDINGLSNLLIIDDV